MSVVNPRNRVVYFRLSEHEFQQLTTFCRTMEGCRSVSELARTAIKALLEDQPRRERSSGGLEDMQQQIHQLEAKVEQVLRLLSASKQG